MAYGENIDYCEKCGAILELSNFCQICGEATSEEEHEEEIEDDG